jgi:hypothetical protein
VIDHDVGTQDWNLITQRFDSDSAATLNYREAKYDSGVVVEQWWDLADRDRVVDSTITNWFYIYREKDAAGTVIRYWYFDDAGRRKNLITTDSTDDTADTGSTPEHEPGDTGTVSDGGWGGESDPTLTVQNLSMAKSPLDDFLFVL